MFLLFDRLKRVRQRQEYKLGGQKQLNLDDNQKVSLFRDYAIFTDESDQDSVNSLIIGSLVRMIHSRGHATEYRNPIAYDDDKVKDIVCYFQVYQVNTNKEFEANEDEIMPTSFTSNSHLRTYPFSNIILYINLSTDSQGVLVADQEELTIIYDEVKKRKSLKIWKKKLSSKQLTLGHEKEIDMSFGILRGTVEPSSSDENNKWYPKRRRVIRLCPSDFLT